MDTDKITESLYKTALKDARYQLQRAAQDYRKAISLQGTSETITIEASIGPDIAFTKDGKPLRKIEVMINYSILIESVTDSLMRIRDKKIRADAITDFLKKFNQFGEYMHQMENYQE